MSSAERIQPPLDQDTFLAEEAANQSAFVDPGTFPSVPVGSDSAVGFDAPFDAPFEAPFDARFADSFAHSHKRAHDQALATDHTSASASRHIQQQAAERLAAHRQRRGAVTTRGALAIVPANSRELKPTAQTSRSTRIASAVAERYARSQSYRDFLAAKAQRAIDEANAAAEIAARSAQAVIETQQRLLAELEAQSLEARSFKAQSSAAHLPETRRLEAEKPSAHDEPAQSEHSQSGFERQNHLQLDPAFHAALQPFEDDSFLWPDAILSSHIQTKASLSPATQTHNPRRAAWSASSALGKADPAEDLFAARPASRDALAVGSVQPTAAFSTPTDDLSGLVVRLTEQGSVTAAGLPQRASLSGIDAHFALPNDRLVSTPSSGAAAGTIAARTTAEAHGALALKSFAHDGLRREALDDEENLALDEEIAFRQTPVFDDPPAPVVSIPGNLLEFPRQLVAARRSRPLLAEGPLRPAGDSPDHSQASPDLAQLRIFEVDPSQISLAPPTESILPEWSSIHLDSPAELATSSIGDFALPLPGFFPSSEQANAAAFPQPHQNPSFQTLAHADPVAAVVLHTAPLSLRAMAAAVDLALVLIAASVLIAVAALISGMVPVGIPAVVSVVGIVALLFVLYQALFFTFSEFTPGMRYARIALCTFADENPTRRAMRRRIPALLLSACPAALGLIWIWLDSDQLAFHDRLTRMYQRSY